MRWPPINSATRPPAIHAFSAQLRRYENGFLHLGSAVGRLRRAESRTLLSQLRRPNRTMMISTGGRVCRCSDAIERSKPGSVAPSATDRSPSPKWLSFEKMSAELLIFAQPKLGPRNRGSQWVLLLDHPGSLNRRRVRNYVADCNNADDRDSQCNDHSDGALHDVAAHGQSPSIGCSTCGADL